MTEQIVSPRPGFSRVLPTLLLLLGRRGMLLVGIIAYILASALCAMRLIAARFVQGLAGGVDIVISQAAQMLHDTLQPEGIHVGQLIIPRGITPGDAAHDPDTLAN